jgi:hypothetical protein|tara:strand:- start:1549 stop:1845 length:297 start_codon:yes stop_codon:yes gene_type:complete
MQVSREVGPEELLLAYQECFGSPVGKVVLTHLAHKFGFIEKSTNVPGDPYGTHINEGHRGVLVYIGKMLSMTTDDLKQPKAAESEPFQQKGESHEGEF